MKTFVVAFLAPSLFLLFSAMARAEVSDVIPVGGVLTDKSGNPLDGDYDMLFALYDVQVGGTPLWYENRNGSNRVHVSDGVFSAELGSLTTIDFLDLISASDLWLGITVGTDSEAGRIHIGSVPYAFEAQYCHQVLGSTCPVGQYLRGWDDDTGQPICERLRLGAGQTSNCGLAYSSGTLAVTGEDGTALSASSPCFVGVRSPTGGRTTTVAFTANVTVTDGPSSETDGNLFGISEADWSSPMPIFLGIVYDGIMPFFTISRMPLYKTGANATDICQKGDNNCDSQGDAMILAESLVLANFTNKPITQVGWLQGTYATSGNAWNYSMSFQTGMNRNVDSIWWHFPYGQNGANSESYFTSSSGVPPEISSSSYDFRISADGSFMVHFYISGPNAGTGTSMTYLALPFHPGWGGYYPVGMYTGMSAPGGQEGTLFLYYSGNFAGLYSIGPTSFGHISNGSFGTSSWGLNALFQYGVADM